MTEAIDRATEAVRRWWTWKEVGEWRRPVRQEQEGSWLWKTIRLFAPPRTGVGEHDCPYCGSPLLPVKSDVPVYPHDEPPDEDESPREALLELRRCAGCTQYQVGGLREAA